jgi:hypothetical protein
MVDQKTGPSRRAFLAGAAAGIAGLQITIPGRARAAGYPERPITVVVMYEAPVTSATKIFCTKYRSRRA